MSISAEVSFEQGSTVILPPVTPGEIKPISDYSQDGRIIIAITCYQQDDGGAVHIFPDKYFTDANSAHKINPEDLHAENRLAVILEGGKFERDIVTSDRKKGHLILQHILGNPHISSLDS